jgi:hypothetical protein
MLFVAAFRASVSMTRPSCFISLSRGVESSWRRARSCAPTTQPPPQDMAVTRQTQLGASEAEETVSERSLLYNRCACSISLQVFVGDPPRLVSSLSASRAECS